MTGHDLSKEGAAMALVLYPEPDQHAAARFRLLKRLRPLMASQNPHHKNIGFFLFGVAEALGKTRRSPLRREAGNA